MELLLPGYKILEQQPGLDGMWRMAEICARVCYKSEDKMSDDITTAEAFVKRVLIHSDNHEKNHGAMLEHATVYLKCPENVYSKYINNKYSKVNYNKTGNYSDYGLYSHELTEYYVTTNLRVVYENDWMDDLQYFCEPTEYHEKRVTVLFTVDRFTGEEFIRHRVMSFGRESTRFVNYVRERFGMSINFILPPWLNNKEDIKPFDEDKFKYICNSICENEFVSEIDTWLFALYTSEWSYFRLVNEFKWSAQQARTVLPCAINSPLVMSGFVSDWKHFFNLRHFGVSGTPHPQASELATPLYNEFVEKKIINEYQPE